MAISYVGGQVGGRQGSTSTNPVSFSFSGGSDTTPSADDLVVVTTVVGSFVTAAGTDITTPTGYTNLTQLVADDTFNTYFGVAYKIMGSTPDSSVTFPSTGSTSNAQSYCIQCFRGVDTTTPMDVTPTSATGIDTGLANPPAITPTTSGSWIVVCSGSGGGSAVTFTYGDLTNVLTHAEDDSNDATVGNGYYTGWTSGSYDPAATTTGPEGGGDSWASYTLALRPAATGPTGSSSKTYGALTGSSSGTVLVAGTSTKTYGALTGTASGTVDVVGASSESYGPLLFSSAGQVLVDGASSESYGALTGTGTGGSLIEGTSTQTYGALTGTATGLVNDNSITGNSSEAYGTLTGSSSGSVSFWDLTGIDSWLFGYTGTRLDRTFQFLKFETGESYGDIMDLWLVFFEQAGFFEGTVHDRMRLYLINYIGLIDNGQTIGDLWYMIDEPYTG